MLRKALFGLVALAVLSAISCGDGLAAGSADIRELRASAAAWQARGDIDRAMDAYEQAIKLASKTYGADSRYLADLYYDAGVTAMRAARFHKAQDCLSSAVRLNPYSPQARIKYAEYLKLTGRHSEAREQALKVLSKHKDCMEAREILALSYQEEGNIGKATQECALLADIASGKVAPQVVVAASAPAMPVAVPPPAPALPSLPSFNLTPKPEDKPAPAPQPKPAAKPAHKAPPKPAPKPKQHKLEKPSRAKKHAEPKHVAPPVKPSAQPPQPVTAVGNLDDKTARLRSKAVLLTPIKSSKTEAESSSTEPVKKERKLPQIDASPVQPSPDPTPEAETKPLKASPAKAAPKPVPPPQIEYVKPIPVKKPKAGLVPPPPPVVPAFPMMPMAAPPPPPPPKPKPKPAPVEKPAEEHHAAPAADEDPDFLLDWAGKKKKGK